MINDIVKPLGNAPEDELAVVDGGFLSWVFGSSPERFYMWKSQSWKEFSSGRRKVIVMDSPHLLRKDYFPEYKGHRAEKADRDPEWEAKVELVRKFRNFIRESNLVKTIELDGYEADDIITALAFLYWREFDRDKLDVIAMDKDLLQMGDFLTLRGFGASSEKDISFEAFCEKQAVKVQPYLHHHSQMLLILALLGDKSDDVPRLVPPRRLDMMTDVLSSVRPWDKAVELFGEEPVKRNLYITVLPGPWVFETLPTEDQVFERVSNLTYWSYNLKQPIVDLYRRAIRPMVY